MKTSLTRLIALIFGAALVLGACAGGGPQSGAQSGGAAGGNGAPGDKPSIVVTTNILGDVVSTIVGDAAEVKVLMPAGADPHSFAVSAQDALSMQNADLLVTNGMNLEEGLTANLDAAKNAGTRTFIAGDHIEVLQYSGEAIGDDPHFWTDPTQMTKVVDALEKELTTNVPAIDAATISANAKKYRDELTALDAHMSANFSTIPAKSRALVTNHHVFGYLAKRYDFKVVGAVIPGGATLASPSASDLSDLAEAVREAGVPAIFTDSSQPDRLVQALAQHTGVKVDVVSLYSESLAEPASEAGTYLDMMRVNTRLITQSLGGAPTS